ncbi:TPA: hypothetical protein ACH3X3_003994 [Trebouxia sp. C0006]
MVSPPLSPAQYQPNTLQRGRVGGLRVVARGGRREGGLSVAGGGSMALQAAYDSK